MEIEYSFLSVDADYALDIGFVHKITTRYIITKDGTKRFIAAECPEDNKTETCNKCLKKIIYDLNR